MFEKHLKLNHITNHTSNTFENTPPNAVHNPNTVSYPHPPDIKILRSSHPSNHYEQRLLSLKDYERRLVTRTRTASATKRCS